MELFRKVTGYGEAERRVEILWGVRESGVLKYTLIRVSTCWNLVE